MLVKFSSTSGHSLSMLEDQAVKMLRAMDISGNIPGAINAEDLQTALDHLEENIQKEAKAEQPVVIPDNASNDERKTIERQVVSAKARAFPLMELLRISIKKQQSVMWEYE